MTKKYLEPTKEILEYLESLNLSYVEMVDYFEIKIYPSEICRYFKKYNIHHKKKYERVNNNLSINGNKIKYNLSKNTILKGRKNKNGL